MPDSDRERAAELIRSSEAAYEHFFNNADDPGWIAPLAAEGFFKNPQPAERGEDWVRYPFWPESRFLVRVAAKAPKQVASVAAAIPDTDNVRVHEDILRIATQLPGRLARGLAQRETRWLHDYDGHLISLPEAIGELVRHLADEDELGGAYALASEALAIHPREDVKYSVRSAGQARMNDYEYGRIIAGAWPSLTDRDALRAFGFLCDLLGKLVDLESREGIRDPTSIWRPAIEGHAQNLGHSLLDLLIDVVRDHAAKVAARPDASFGSVLAELALRNRAIFDRIALNFIREHGDPETVAAALADPFAAFDVSRWHEYGELLRARFGDLGQAQRSEVVSTLDQGYRDDHRSHLRERGATDDVIDTWQRRDLLSRYILIRDDLDAEHRETLDRLLEDSPEPDHPTFLSYSTSWTGPTSPFGADELRALSPLELTETLRTWDPPGGANDATPEGLGRILSDVVQESPMLYADAASLFEGLEPAYVRALLRGLADAAQKGEGFSWGPVLLLCSWVLDQPRSVDDASGNLDRDPHWGLARKQIADLLSRGLASGGAELGIADRTDVWRLISVLAEDRDPTPSQEEQYGGDNMDPATLSINTTRGEAFHAIMRYTLWLERHGHVDGMSSIPEVQHTLEQHLDPRIDPSVAVRSVYGQWFPQLARIDREWARAIAPTAFPVRQELAHLFGAAWHAYILFNQAYDEMYDILEDAYRHAATNLDNNSPDGLAGDPCKRLGDHLFFFQARGVLSHIPNLLSEYWQRASTSLRSEMLSSVGWSLERTSELEQEMVDALADAWSWILDEARTSDSASLSGFGAWFAADALPARWRLEQALVVLKQDVHLEPDYAVYETLPKLAEAAPDRALEILRRMITTDTEGYSPWGSVAGIKSTLRITHDSADPVIRRRSQEIADLLGARGLSDFRELGQP